MEVLRTQRALFDQLRRQQCRLCDRQPPLNQRVAYVTQAAKDEVAAVVTLKTAGARYIIIPNLPESFGGANAQTLRAAYNTALWNGLAAAGVNFIPADFNGLRKEINAKQAAFRVHNR